MMPKVVWLAQCRLTPEQMKNQMEPEYTPLRRIHLYHCDHRGLLLPRTTRWCGAGSMMNGETCRARKTLST